MWHEYGRNQYFHDQIKPKRGSKNQVKSIVLEFG